jgi:hypothetical protein
MPAFRAWENATSENICAREEGTVFQRELYPFTKFQRLLLVCVKETVWTRVNVKYYKSRTVSTTHTILVSFPGHEKEIVLLQVNW